MKPIKFNLKFFVATAILIAGFFLIGRVIYVLAVVPDEVNFQGKLTDINGVNVANGNYNFQVRIYDHPTNDLAPNLLYTQTLNGVAVTNGIFNLKFSPANAALNSTDTYLQVCFDSNATGGDATVGCGTTATSTSDTAFDKRFLPRKLLRSNPYSLVSKFLGSNYIQGGDGSESGALSFGGTTGISVSNAGAGKMYFDSSLNKFRCSQNGAAYVDCVGGGSGSGVTQINTTGPITGGPITSTGTIGITQSSASSNGYLSSTDWSTFNGKENAITAGTTAQFWRGDKSWQTIPTCDTNQRLSWDGTDFNCVNVTDGTVTGTGTATQVAFWNTSTTLTSSANLFWDNTNNRLGIGTSSPTQALDVVGNADINGNIAVGNNATVSNNLGIYNDNNFTSLPNFANREGIRNFGNFTGTGNPGQLVGFRNNMVYDGFINGGFLAGIENTVDASNMTNIPQFYAMSSTMYNTNSSGLGDISNLQMSINNTNTSVNTQSGINIGSYFDGGNISSYYAGVRIQRPSIFNSAVIGRNYGIAIDDQSGIGTTDSFNIASYGTSSINYFQGGLQMGYGATGVVTNPGVSLADTGIIYFDNQDEKFKCSENTGAYFDCFGATGITGSGSATQVAFWTGGSTLGGNSNLWWDNTNNRLGIGTSTPGYSLDTTGDINTTGVYKIGAITVLDSSSGHTYVGANSGQNDTGGTGNVFVGNNVGTNNSGILNTFINAGSGVNTGSTNTFIGSSAGASNTGGAENVFIGYQSGNNNTVGGQNTYIGNLSGISNTTATRRTFTGYEAGRFSTGANNAYFGYRSGYNNTSGNENSFFGTSSGVNITTGADNSMLGYATQSSLPSASGSIALGAYANITTSNQLVAGSLPYGISDSYFGNGVTSIAPLNTRINASGGEGTDIGGANLTLAGGISTGTAYGGSLIFQTTPNGGTTSSTQNTPQDRLTIDGQGAFTYTSSNGTPPVAPANTGRMIYYSLPQKFMCSENGSAYFECFHSNSVTGSGTATQVAFWDTNSSISSNSNLYWNNTNNRLGIGTSSPGQALDVVGTINSSVQYNLLGQRFASGSNSTWNTFLGLDAGAANTSGVENLYVGKFAGQSNTSGSSNIFIGPNAGGSQTGDSGSVYVGEDTGAGCTSSCGLTTAIGYSAGYHNGDVRNTYLGANTDASGAFSNSVALGYGAVIRGSNQLVVGTSVITSAYFGGVVDGSPTNFTINSSGGSGSNIVGANLLFAGGKSTGTASGGSLVFQTAPASGVSGSTANSLVSRFTIDSLGAFTFGAASSTPSASPASQGKIYYDAALQKFQCSENTGAYFNCFGGTALTGSGTANQVAFWTSSSNLSSSSKLFYDSTNNRFAVGTSSPTGEFQVDVGTETSGGITMTASNGATTFTTSASITLNVGDYIVPNLQSSQARVITVGGTGTSFTVTPAFDSAVSGRTFNISRKVMVQGSRPLLSLRSTLLGTREWQMRVGALQPGGSAWDLYDATAGKTRLTVDSTGQFMIGTDQNFGGVGNASRMFVYGGTNGANIDVMGDPTQLDQAVIELEGSDYITNTNSIKMEYSGPGAIGTTMGVSNANLGSLTWGNAANALIGTANSIPLRIFTNSVEQVRFEANGDFTSGITATSGATTLDIGGTGTGNAVCHSGAAGATDNVGIVDCTSAPSADYMEMYSVMPDAIPGDILVASDTYILTKDFESISKLKKSTGNSNDSIIGIMSDKSKAGDFNSIGYNINASDNPQPIALNGRVYVNVDPNSPAINTGDLIGVSSNVSGKGTKAIGAGFVVGKALENWTPNSGKTKVMVFVGYTYYNPSIVQNANSNWTLNGNILTTTNDIKAANASFDTLKIGLNKLNIDVSGNLVTTGNISSSNLTVAGLLSANKAVFSDLEVQNLTIASNTANGDSIVGTTKILAGQDKVVIDNKNVKTNSKIFLTLKTTDSFAIIAVSNITEGVNFEVKINQVNPTKDTEFNYWIVDTK